MNKDCAAFDWCFRRGEINFCTNQRQVRRLALESCKGCQDQKERKHQSTSHSQNISAVVGIVPKWLLDILSCWMGMKNAHSTTRASDLVSAWSIMIVAIDLPDCWIILKLAVSSFSRLVLGRKQSRNREYQGCYRADSKSC